MDTNPVPDLDWPKDLFRDDWRIDALDDPENPFWEASDLAQATKSRTGAGRAPCRRYEVAQ